MVTPPQISLDTLRDVDMCFGCGVNNPIGLKLNFQQEGDVIRAEFTPTKNHQGWADVVHGGLIHCMLDEAMSYATMYNGMCCVTAKMETRFRRPAPLGEPLIITSSILRHRRQLVETQASISLKDGTLIAESTASMIVISPIKLDAVKKEIKPKTTAKAVIWDMDGVIADTGQHHFRAWQKTFAKRGVNFTEEDFRRQFGQRNDSIIRHHLGEKLSQDEVDAFAKEKEATYRRLARGKIKPLAGAVELLKSLRKHGFKAALATSAPAENIRLVVQSLGISDYFDVIVAGRDVKEGKPSPQGFLLAAQKLRVEPQNCVIIEDAIAGIMACKRAGSHCIAVTNTHPEESLRAADLVVDSLEKVSIEDLERLINL